MRDRGDVERVLSAAHLATVAAAMDQILPSDGDGPGAADANAIGHVEWLMREGRSGAIIADLEAAAIFLDSIAQALAKQPYAACDGTVRQVALVRLEGTPHARAQRAFGTLVRVTLAGFLCDPEFGGNRDACGWRYIHHVPFAAVVATAGRGHPHA